MHKLSIHIFMLLILTVASETYGISYGHRGNVHGFETGFTAAAGVYKSYVSSFIYARRKSSTPIFQPHDETSIYNYFIRKILKPRYLLAQATLYPMATLSSHLETYEFDLYKHFDVYSINLMRALGAGYQDPYALSLLLGNICLLGFKGKTDVDKNGFTPTGSALSGFLLSTGHRYIYDNIVVDNRWWLIEYILIGTFSEKRRRAISWNFRAGYKKHSWKMIQDEFMFAVQRDHISFDWHALSFIKNSRIVYELNISLNRRIDAVAINRQLVSYSKKIPLVLNGRDIVIRIGAGVVWEDIFHYDHMTNTFDTNRRSRTGFLFQPSIEF